MKKTALVPFVSDIDRLILTVRDQKVILDTDMAAIYGVSTRRLNEQVKRNDDRFPPDFAFQLTPEEWALIRSQAATSSGHRSHFGTSSRPEHLKSQFATSSWVHGGRRKLPFAFTEHGAIMVANVLKSAQAAQMSVFVVRAFVKLRAALADSQDLARKLAAVEAELKSRLDVHEAAIVDVLQRIMEILAPPPPPPGPPEPPKPQIGFHVKADPVPYRTRSRPATAASRRNGPA